MSRVACLALLAVLGACAAPGAKHAPPLQPVPALDVERYLGRWYEIARTPNRFQQGCVATTATYGKRADGSLSVLNECRKDGADGALRSVSGKAWQSGGADSARLKVQFFWPFAADYWVIALDPQYRWAIVGEPSRKYLWVLARTPALDEALYTSLLERTRELGYDPARLQRTPQPGG